MYIMYIAIVIKTHTNTEKTMVQYKTFDEPADALAFVRAIAKRYECELMDSGCIGDRICCTICAGTVTQVRVWGSSSFFRDTDGQRWANYDVDDYWTRRAGVNRRN